MAARLLKRVNLPETLKRLATTARMEASFGVPARGEVSVVREALSVQCLLACLVHHNKSWRQLKWLLLFF